MELEAQLRILQAVEGDPSELALATVDLAFPTHTDDERSVIKEALVAAAIPHWCDEDILAALLEISHHDAAARLSLLRRLRVVEPFPARGPSAVNVHEATRLTLRKATYEKSRQKLEVFGRRAAAYFAGNHTSAGRIEQIYHLLCSDPDLGIEELEIVDFDWSTSRRCPEDQSALAAALGELEETGIVQGRARTRALLYVAWRQVDREMAFPEKAAEEILHLARDSADPWAEAEALWLLGRAVNADAKKAAWGEFLDISRRQVGMEPTSVRWQRELAVARAEMAFVLVDEGKLEEARHELEACLDIYQHLAEIEPGRVGWQRELSIMHARLGLMLAKEDRRADAEAAFQASLAIVRRLVHQDPTNDNLQEDLCDVLAAAAENTTSQANLEGAQALLEEAQRIGAHLVGQDPSNTAWRFSLVKAYLNLGKILEAQGKLAESEAAWRSLLPVLRPLTERSPTNAEWQLSLAVAYYMVGRLLELQGKPELALGAVGKLLQFAMSNPDQAGIASYQESLGFRALIMATDIAEKAHKRDPRSVTSGQVVAVTYFYLFQRARTAGDTDAVNRFLTSAYLVLHEMVSAGCELDPAMGELHRELDEVAKAESSAPPTGASP